MRSLVDYYESDSYVELAKLSYESPETKTIDEFVEDFSRFKYVKRLINRYTETGEVKVQLILNHLILIFNVFQKDAAVYILVDNNKEAGQRALKTFLYFLNQIEVCDSELDYKILKELYSI